jgi:hypothetical protein
MVNGIYIIPVWDTIKTAWEKVDGAKQTIWGALIVFFAIMFGLGFIEGIFKDSSPALSIVIKIIANVVAYFLQMGTLYIGIKRAYDLPIEYKQIFRVFEADIALKMVMLYILQILIFLPIVLFLVAASFITAFIPTISPAIPILLFIIGGAMVCYISIRMIISNAFILDKATQPLDAIKMSFKATRDNFWNCLGLTILQMLIIAVSALPLAIGLIWTLPLTFICYGVMYKRLQANC